MTTVAEPQSRAGPSGEASGPASVRLPAGLVVAALATLLALLFR
ncbi:hypothetical protein [Burkholderia cepacia]|nr:hypothetical protein [Burkholderia cepacia]